MLRMRRTTVILLFFACLSCWERQDIDILPPRIPNYKLFGYTIDIDDSARVLPDTPVSLLAVTMFYDVTFETARVLSDSTGYYQIDSVFPGNYLIFAKRDGYKVFQEGITVEHAARNYTVRLPKPILDYGYFRPTGSPIGWKDRWLWTKGNAKLGSGSSSSVIRIWLVSTNRVEPIGYYRNPAPEAEGIEYINGRVYAYDPKQVCLLSPADASLITSWETEEPISGLAGADSGFWTTNGSMLQFRGIDLKTVEASYETCAGRLQSLTISGDRLWAFDRDRSLILKLDERGNILASYYPVDFESGTGIRVQDMEFRSEGMLYVSGASRFYLFLTDKL